MGPCVLLRLTGVLITNGGNDVTYDVTVDNVPFVSWESEADMSVVVVSIVSTYPHSTLRESLYVKA